MYFFGFADWFYYLGIRRKCNVPERVYSNEAIFFLGVATTAAAIAYFGKVIDTVQVIFHYSCCLHQLFMASRSLVSFKTCMDILVIILRQLGWSRNRLCIWLGCILFRYELSTTFRIFGIVLLAASTYAFKQWSSRWTFFPN